MEIWKKIWDDVLSPESFVGDEHQLLCPHCGNGWTHLKKVKPYTTREGEDRPCVELVFTCEMCGNNKPFSLFIQQHKGMTYFTDKPWDKSPVEWNGN